MLKCLNLNISFDLDYSAGELRDLPLPVGWHYDSIRGYEVDVGVVDVLVDHGEHHLVHHRVKEAHTLHVY